jgi:hypothetical protein
MCEILTKLTLNDFKCVGDVAFHCDTNKLCISTNQAFNFDLELCDDFKNIAFNNINSTEQKWIDLWCGSSFESCGISKKHLGLKYVLSHYSYARYVLLNQYQDTGTGLKQKTNDFSIPIPYKELEMFSNNYKKIAIQSFEKIKEFLCIKNEIYNSGLKCENYDCKPCDTGCDTKKEIRSYIIEKN